MKESIIQRLAAVLSALNAVSVSGRANLNNLSGSMAIIEDVIRALNDVDVVSLEAQGDGNDGSTMKFN